jgi:hypothetical protein
VFKLFPEAKFISRLNWLKNLTSSFEFMLVAQRFQALHVNLSKGLLTT